MNVNPCTVKVSSFDLSKAMTFSKIFSKIKLSPSARLVLRCLVDFYNPNKGLVFPSQKTIAECTGASENSVTNAINELRAERLILSTKHGAHLNYYFTNIFFELLGIGVTNPKNCDSITPKIGDKQHEYKQINNKNKILNFQKQSEGVNYISPETTRKQINESLKRDDKSPYNDLETALKYIDDLSGQMHNDLIRKQVEKIKAIWNL